MLSLLTPTTPIKVSSTLDNSVAKKNLIDRSPETCWTSQAGLPQWIQITFPQRVIPKRLSLTFQGGFVGTRCSLQIPSPDMEPSAKKMEWRPLTYVYPENVNRRQSFDITQPEHPLVDGGIQGIRLVFEESSDFFGRVTIYDLQLEGDVVGTSDVDG